jgi:hypothetical protein
MKQAASIEVCLFHALHSMMYAVQVAFLTNLKINRLKKKLHGIEISWEICNGSTG